MQASHAQGQPKTADPQGQNGGVQAVTQAMSSVSLVPQENLELQVGMLCTIPQDLAHICIKLFEP